MGLKNLQNILDKFVVFEDSIKSYEKDELDTFVDASGSEENYKYFKLYNKISESYKDLKELTKKDSDDDDPDKEKDTTQ